MDWQEQYKAPTNVPTSMQTNKPTFNTLQEYQAYQAQNATEQPKKSKNFLLDQISTVGGILGGIGGSFIAPIAGTAAGAGAGSALGEAIENLIMGEDIGKNVLKEGALGAVFGAGPIKLLKGAGAGASALIKGAGGAAAKQAAKTAAMTPLKQTVGKALLGASDDLAVKTFRFTPSQLASFKAKFGEDAGKVIKKYGFSNADDIIAKGIDPLKQQFNQNIGNIAGVSKESLKSNFQTKISKLLQSKSSDQRALGKQLQKESNSILKGYGDVIDANELNAVKKEFDSLVNYTSQVANPAKYGVNKRVADTLRQTLQQADETGTLKNIGLEINKLSQLSKSAAKQAELGRGSLPLGLSSLLGASAGGAAGGGPLGAVGGLVASKAINSQAGRTAAMKGAEVLGNKLVSSPIIGNTAKGIAGRVGVAGAAGSLLKGQDSGMSSASDTMMNPMTNANMGSQYTQQAQSSNPYPREALMYDMQRDPANADKYVSYYKQFQELFPEQTNKEYSSVISGNISDFQSSLNELSNLSAAISSGKGSTDPIMGRLRSLNPYDTEQQTLQAMIDKTRQIVGKALEGGVLRKEDEEKYKKILPTTSDTKEVAMNKIAMITSQLSQKMQNYSSLVGAGGQSQSIEDIIMQQSGGY
jgi:CHAD domain-containing protein